ncbi:MAG: carboxylesterase family protein, partial [Acidobacteriota bacterium]|nr:carboxylesterase family protein [Acidobacteriota bacterium]
MLSNRINRRTLLNKGAAVVGGAAAGLALQPENALAQKTPSTGSARPAVGASAPHESPNLHPPVVEVKAGKLRGFRDGRTYTFLGIPYAEADRFELPKPVQPWEGIKSAQAWGPVCPVPASTATGPDEFVFPHRYWVQNEHCQVLNIWTQSLNSKTKKP